jgi:hypothetical protein
MTTKNQLWCICLAQIVGVAVYVYWLVTYGYLPSPFYHDKGDSLMDFYNSLYWAARPGIYEAWKSVYPPLNFVLLRLLNYIFISDYCFMNPFVLRTCGTNLNIFLLTLYLTVPLYLLLFKYWRDFAKDKYFLCYILVISSTPLLFALERGNLVLLCLFMFPLLFNGGSLLRGGAIAILINIKPYFLCLWLVYIVVRRPIDWLISMVITLLIFFVSTLFIELSLTQLITNLVGFSNHQLPNAIDLFNFNNSVDIFSRVASADSSLVFPGVDSAIVWLHFLIELLNTGKNLTFIILFVVLFIYGKTAPLNLTLLAITALITNLSLSFGGYVLLLYVPFLPFVVKLFYAKYFIICYFFIIAPLDLLWAREIPRGLQWSYFVDKSVFVVWHFSYLQFLRPLANLTILIILIIELDKNNLCRQFVSRGTTYIRLLRSSSWIGLRNVSLDRLRKVGRWVSVKRL